MSIRKYNKVARLSETAKFGRTFQSRLKDIPSNLLKSLTAKQIAEIIDGPMEASYRAGWFSSNE